MEEQLNPENFKIIGAFVIGIITMGIIPLIKVIGATWKRNAPLREERKRKRLEKRKNKIS